MEVSEQQMTIMEKRIIEELTFLADHVFAIEKQLQLIIIEMRTKTSMARETAK